MEILLVTIALFERLVVDFGPNIELVTTVSILAGLYLSKRASWVVPLVVMAASDAVLGWGVISFFTWTGFLLMGWLPRWLKGGNGKMFKGMAAAMLGNLSFFVWTNFGVWLTDRWGMYARNLSGLGMAYVNGLPFLKMQLYSSWLFLPMAIWMIEYIFKPVWQRGQNVRPNSVTKAENL